MVKSNHLTREFYSKRNSLNAIFFPGFPGEYKDRPLTDDLKTMGYNIYSAKYPGTFGKTGEFSANSVEKYINEAAAFSNNTRMNTLLITYSFSTYFVLKSIRQFKNIIGIILFSPILDLHKSIFPNFVKDLVQLENNPLFNINSKSFVDYIKTNDKNYLESYEKTLRLLNKKNIPIIYSIGVSDTVIKRHQIESFLLNYKNRYGQNKLFTLSVKDSTHKLDLQYDQGSIRKIIATISLVQQVKKFMPKVNAYLWGGSLNYRYGNKDSDVDLILVNSTFSIVDVISINKLVNVFSKSTNIVFDISNNVSLDLVSEQRIRSNRGPSFVHEIKYYYFPILNGSKKIAEPSKKSIVNDAISANKQNFYMSVKTLLNYGPLSEKSSYVLKYFLFGTYYDQYIKGNLFPNQNYIENYYKGKNKDIHYILKQIRMIKSEKTSYNLMFLKKVIHAHAKLCGQISHNTIGLGINEN